MSCLVCLAACGFVCHFCYSILSTAHLASSSLPYHCQFFRDCSAHAWVCSTLYIHASSRKWHSNGTPIIRATTVATIRTACIVGSIIIMIVITYTCLQLVSQLHRTEYYTHTLFESVHGTGRFCLSDIYTHVRTNDSRLVPINLCMATILLCILNAEQYRQENPLTNS